MKSSSKLGAHITPHKERMMYTPPDRRKHVIKQVPAGKKGYTKKQSLDYQSRYRYKTNTNWVVQIDKLVCNMICIKNFAGYVRAAKSKRPIKLVPRPIMEGIFKDYTNGSEYNGELVLESTKVVDEECETVNYKTMTSGAHGIAPVKVLLYLCRNLFVLKGPGQKETFYKLPWHNIQIPEDKEAKKGIFGAYAMLHWKNGEFSVGMDNDFKESGKQWLDNDTLDALEEFGLDVARSVFFDKLKNCNYEALRKKFKIFPGFVTTLKSYHQHFHLDEETDKSSLFLHMPVHEGGMYIRLYDCKDGEKGSKVQEIHVPFGTFIVLPAYVYHSGVYGDPGNTRLHLVIRHIDSGWDRDDLVPHPDVEMFKDGGPIAETTDWKKWADEDGVNFSQRYINMLRRNFHIFFKDSYLKTPPVPEDIIKR